MSENKQESERNDSITIREAIDRYSALSSDARIELAYLIEYMTDDEFTDYLQAQEQDCKKNIQMGILSEEELVALQAEALAERISRRLNVDFDAVLELIDSKFSGHATREEDIVFAAMCKDFSDLETFYKKICEKR